MEIKYWVEDKVGHLEFNVLNGAMDLAHCEELLLAYQQASEDKSSKIIVLWGGRDFFSNGIDLNSIHLRYNPTILAYKNLKALNRIVKAVMSTSDKLTLSAIRGSAAAGGVMLALSADLRYARETVVLNPNYVNMGLSGSEYWSVLLPSLAGYGMTQKLAYEASPISSIKAREIGLIHEVYDSSQRVFTDQIKAIAGYLSKVNLHARLAAKEVLNHRLLKDADEQVKLELKKMKDCCNHPEFKEARDNFVNKKTGAQIPFEAILNANLDFLKDKTD